MLWSYFNIVLLNRKTNHHHSKNISEYILATQDMLSRYVVLGQVHTSAIHSASDTRHSSVSAHASSLSFSEKQRKQTDLQCSTDSVLRNKLLKLSTKLELPLALIKYIKNSHMPITIHCEQIKKITIRNN